MKGRAIAKIVICSILAVVLIAVLAFCLWGGDIILPGISISIFDGDGDEGYLIGDGSVQGEINKLDVSWISGSVTIKYHDKNETILRETKVEKEEHRMRYKLEDGVLSIEPCKGKGVSIQIGNDLAEKDLEILLPRDMAEICEIELVSADLSMEGLQFKKAELATVSGEIHLADCDFDSLNVDAVSGNLQAENVTTREFNMDSASANGTLFGEVRDVCFDTVSGNLNMQLENHPDRLEFDSVSGNCDLTMPADTQFRVECDGIRDKMSIINFAVEKEKDTYWTSGWKGNGGCDMEFDLVSGTVTITGAE